MEKGAALARVVRYPSLSFLLIWCNRCAACCPGENRELTNTTTFGRDQEAARQARYRSPYRRTGMLFTVPPSPFTRDIYIVQSDLLEVSELDTPAGEVYSGLSSSLCACGPLQCEDGKGWFVPSEQYQAQLAAAKEEATSAQLGRRARARQVVVGSRPWEGKLEAAASQQATAKGAPPITLTRCCLNRS